jgi:TonB-linked SusC/RagA family outer membrane protein
MRTQEISFEGQTTIDVVLKADVIGLDEVVAVGYGTMKKADLTGSVASVSKEVFQNQVLSSPEQGLQGRIAGVQVTTGSSAPGGGISIQIRGSNSINGNSEPLYVVDGVPYASVDQYQTSGGGGNVNPLSSINPDDIESIDILKDASSTAIYGARGANGVVLITTKRGKTGKPSISFSSSYGVQKMANKIDVFNMKQFADYQVKQAEALGVSFNLPPMDIDTDWQDELYDTAPIQKYYLSVNGGTETVKYSMSTGYQNQEGIIRNSGFDRFSFATNLDVKMADWLTWGSSLSVSRSSWQRVSADEGGIPLLAVNTYPGLTTGTNEDGTYPLQGEISYSVPGTAGMFPLLNPMAELNEKEDEEIGNRIFGNTFFDFKLMDNLTFKSSFGVDIDTRARDKFIGSLAKDGKPADLLVSYVERTTWINENIATYTKSFDDHNFTVLGGWSIQKDVNRFRTITTSNLTNEETKTDDLSAGTTPGVPISNRIQSNLVSGLARVNYNYKDRYLLALSGRYDGSSKFAKNNKWGFFPSAAFGWRLSEEAFLSNADFISNLKLRLSWGVTGNQGFSPYASLAVLGLSNYNDNDKVLPGFYMKSVANPNLKWEETSQINMGVDLGILNGRVNFTFDYYQKETNDLILSVKPPKEIGKYDAIPLNVGSLENKGVEFLVDANITPRTTEFQWNASFNISKNKNKVLSIITEEDIVFGDNRDAAIQTRVSVGQPIGSFYGWKTDGIYNTEEELNSSPKYSGAEVGDIKIVDTDGDGDVDNDDQTFIGNPEPDFYYGFSSNMSYKGFGLDMHFQGVSGGSVANLNNFYLAAPHARTNKLAMMEDVWTPNNVDAKYPKPGKQDGFGTTGNDMYIVEDASYFRLKDITLSYKFEKLPIKGLSSVKVYATATNLFTITDYTGYNPDVNSAVSTGGNGNTRRGIDSGAYPLAKSFIFGFNVNLRPLQK